MPFGRFGLCHSIMRLRSGLVFLILALFASATPRASAELTWAQKTVELNGDARSPVLEARFHFTNTGGGPVEIRNVESSCGCTTTALEKRTYKPGEAGEIVAKYTVGAHTGLQRKTLIVLTDDGLPPTTLTLVAHIQEILRVTPTAVTWSHHEATAPKRISLELVQDAPFDDISVESSVPGVTATLVPVTRGRKYNLIVSPGQTDSFLLAKLTIHCRFGQEEKTFVAYATVKPAANDH